MKRLFYLFLLGVIAGFAVYLCVGEKQQIHARKGVVIKQDSAPCLSMALDSHSTPQSSIHRAGSWPRTPGPGPPRIIANRSSP